MFPQVEHLTEGTFYEFKVQAGNMAGVGLPSAPSAPMKCAAWTMDEPGERPVSCCTSASSSPCCIRFVINIKPAHLCFLSVSPSGPAYDLSFSEVRGHSLVVLWKAPVYTGASAVTGYLVDMAKMGSKDFVTLNEEAVNRRYLQVRA